MARFQIPDDPRNEKRPRRLRQDSREPVPWKWLGMGAIVTVVSIFLAISLANRLLAREPLPVSEPVPTIIVLTAPPTAPPTATAVLELPTAVPTFTPIPTPDNALAPAEITVGFYVQVTGTEIGLTVRGGPSTSNAQVTIADDGTVLLVVGGPEIEPVNDRLWWQVELQDGTTGWVAGDFLQPTDAP
jgi:hypothetical protein